MYEYQVLKAATLINEEQLSDQAKDGWRLIEIVQYRGQFYFYFERLVAQ